MHKHEGIVVAVWLEGQPASEMRAALDRTGVALVDEFVTEIVRHDGQQGLAAKVNLYCEAENLVDDLTMFCDDCEPSVLILDEPGHGWRVK